MTPATASSGFSSDVESMSSMPWSRSAPATAPISPSVFLKGSFISSVRKRHRAAARPRKIFVCFTCPAITAWVTPASFIRRMHFPSSPREIQ